jgi:plasmid stabilization system protein ParE
VTLDLIVHDEAREDLKDQHDYLEDHNPGSGERFLAEVLHVFDRLVTFPGFGHPFPTPTWPSLRRVVLPTFPLSVFYEPSATAIDVYHVLHHAQDVLTILDRT